jgi:phage shock protein PspC (stress-responsive transcriptional regulator)
MDHDTQHTPDAEPADEPGAQGGTTTMADHEQEHEHEAPSGDPRAGAGNEPRRLRRGPGGPVAGVCEGIGRYLAIDPTIVRVAFVVAAVLGGIGLVAYGAAWLLVPRWDDANPDVLRVERGPRLLGGLLLAIAAVAIVANVGVAGPFGLYAGPGLLVAAGLIGAGLYLLTREPQDATRFAAATPTAPRPAAGAPSSSGPAPWTASPPAAPPPPTPPAPAEPEEAGTSFPLTALALGVITLASGVMLALDLADVVDPVLRDYAVLGLVVCGIALVASAFFGRALALIPVGAVFAVLLAAGMWAPGWWDDGIGERTYDPVSVSELRPDYELGIGDLELDLRGLDLAGTTQHVRASVGIGSVTVLLPRGVDIEARGAVDAGVVTILGQQHDGWRDDELLVREDAPGDAKLVLDADVDLGSIEVRHG